MNISVAKLGVSRYSSWTLCLLRVLCDQIQDTKYTTYHKGHKKIKVSLNKHYFGFDLLGRSN